MGKSPATNVHQKGFGLVETLLVLGAVSALSLGIYMVLKPASASAQAKVEQDNLGELSSAIDRSFGLTGGFEGLSANRVVADRLAPQRMTTSGVLSTRWGSAVTVAAQSIRAPNDAFVVTYPATPSEVCSRLAAGVARSAYDIKVGGHSVLDSGQLNVTDTASHCSSTDRVTMEFVYHSGLIAGTAVAAPALLLPPAPPGVSTPPSAPIGGPVGPVGPVGPAGPPGPIVQPPAPAPPSAPPLSPPPGTPISPATPPSSPPAVPPTTPPSVLVTACAIRPNTVQNQNVDCAAGSYGVIAQSRFATWSCPEAWEGPVQGPFSSWTTLSSTCAACPAPATQTQTQWVSTSINCPPGSAGTHTWEREQVSSRSVSYNCPAGTRTLPGATLGGWSAWSDTGTRRGEVNTCAPTTELCSDGSEQLAAWFWADYGQLPPGPSVVVVPDDTRAILTPEERERFAAAQAFTPVERTEDYAGPPNSPPNVSEGAGYFETCNNLSDVGNIQYSYSYSFECVSNMGMHYCDYSAESGGYQFAVCRRSCASQLVGKSNNPYFWSWPSTSAMPSTYTNCTGSSCVTNGNYGGQNGLPACNASNVGQTITHRWYRQFYNPVRIVYAEFPVTCAGPTPSSNLNSCSVPAGSSFSWTMPDLNSPYPYGSSVTCTAATGAAQTLANGASLTVTDSSGAETGTASFKCNNGKVATIQDGGSVCAVTAAAPCQSNAGRLYSWKVDGRFCQAAAPTTTSVPSGSTITVRDTNQSNTNVGLSPRQGQATFQCYNGYFLGIPSNATCN